MNILCFIQSDANGTINRNSLESLVCSQEVSKKLNSKLTLITFDEKLIPELANYECDQIFNIETQKKEYHPISYCDNMVKALNDLNPNYIIFGHTYEVRDWVPRLSAITNIPFISDCIGLKLSDSIVFTKQISQGKLNVDISSSALKNLISIQSGNYKVDNIAKSTQNPEIITKNYDVASDLKIIPGEKFKEQQSSINLSQSNIIVSAGRGIEKKENIELINQLAQSINADVGCSRPVVDSGWLDHDRQIGSSGHIVNPKLYFAVGISGAVQHQVGMKGSENIIAINKDSNAPIFEIADVGVVGDLFEIVPKLIEKINT